MASSPSEPLLKVTKMMLCGNCANLSTKGHSLQICPCQRAAYCDRECQKVAWKDHKKICIRQRAFLDSINSGTIHSNGVSDVDAFAISEKWQGVQTLMLGDIAAHALNLSAFPNRIKTHVFKITVSPTFTSQKLPKSLREIGVAFELVRARVLPLNQAKECLATPEDGERLAAELAETEPGKQVQFRGPGKWLGKTVILVNFPFFDQLNLVPWDILGPLEPRNANWLQLLGENLKTGEHLERYTIGGKIRA